MQSLTEMGGPAVGGVATARAMVAGVGAAGDAGSVATGDGSDADDGRGRTSEVGAGLSQPAMAMQSAMVCTDALMTSAPDSEKTTSCAYGCVIGMMEVRIETVGVGT